MGLRKLKGENGEVIYAEEYIPVSFKDLENIQDKRITNLSQKLKSIENNKKHLEFVKNSLIFYSFQLQDPLSENHFYLNKSIKDLYENKENIEKEIQAIRTLVF